jgi:thiaminase (transcriptional activator TenA)
LTAHLFEAGAPFVAQELEHPTVLALMRGSLTDAQARYWLEQDYLYLLDEIRVLARLAWQAPPSHRADLIDLAWNVIHEELPKHMVMCEQFGAQLDGAVKGPATTAYTAWLLDAAADYGIGMVALLSGLWGYSRLGQRMTVPSEPRFKEWVESYQDPSFPALARRYADMVDEVPVDPRAATTTFVEGMRHALAFWAIPQASA